MEALVRTRAGQKGSLTRAESFIIANTPKLTVTPQECKTRHAHLTEVFKQFYQTQEEIEHLDVDKTDTLKREEVEDRFFKALAQLNDMAEPRACTHGTSTSFANSSPPAVKLPNIEVPPFSGNPADWVSFYELFTTLITDNHTLNDVQRLIYLKSYLRNEPLKLISTLPLTSDNFSIAINTLKKRYSNKLLLVNTHIRALFELPGITKCTVHNLREFITRARQNIESLNKMISTEELCNLTLFYLLEHKLDFGTRRGFEHDRATTNLPTIDDLLEYLNTKCVSLETLNPDTRELDRRSQQTPRSQNHFAAKENGKPFQRGQIYKINCTFCHSPNHKIYTCTDFINTSLHDKRRIINERKLCSNCLGAKHSVEACTSKGCHICSKRHHTMMHQPASQVNSASTAGQTSRNRRDIPVVREEPHGFAHNDESTSSYTQVGTLATRNGNVLLATANVILYSTSGDAIPARALLDSGSQSSIITDELFRKLHQKSFDFNLKISGISQKNTSSSKMVDVTIFSKIKPQSKFKVSCAILPHITCKLPQMPIDQFAIPQDVQLADPEFFIPAKIDLLLGADVYYELLMDGLIRLGSNRPVLQNTHLGWLIAGNIPHQRSVTSATSIALLGQVDAVDNIEQALTRFWTIEEIPQTPILSPEDEKIEYIYSTTTKVLENGRYQVNIPLKSEREYLRLGDSFGIAKRRFAQLEKRFDRDPPLRQEYARLVNEYVEAGYGKYVPLSLLNERDESKYFLPHHCVIKDINGRKKLRIVHDASCKSATGVSLNDITLKGFSVQPDLYDILCRFRASKFVLTADIEKMYLQIRINPDHTFLQNILWREHPGGKLKCIELGTVIFGTKFAPYVATRTINALADKVQHKYPLAAKVLKNSTYVDDILLSCDDLEELLETLRQLKMSLSSAGFHLHKFASNSQRVTEGCYSEPDKNYEVREENTSNKVLGISWDATSDQFSVSIPSAIAGTSCTKREVLSKLAQMYDPLGLVNPVIVKGKILMQKLWINRIDWDETLLPPLRTEWEEFLDDLPFLSNLKIPRFLFDGRRPQQTELHGFADASLKAYGACVYVRAVYPDNTVSSTLITAKSRVAPIKTVSLPRLELCGMVMLAKLARKATEVLNILEFKTINLWTDSQIALQWIKSHPSRWTTFVANRVSQIQEITPNCHWRHVKSADNPADLLSRGALARELIDSDLWLHGPKFLSQSQLNLVELNIYDIPIEIPEVRKVSLTALTDTFLNDVFSRFSSFTRMQRTIAWCLRFIKNALKTASINGPLKPNELNKSLNLIIRAIQGKHFAHEIAELKEGKSVSKKEILRLHPFLDDEGIIRVGGRLSQAPISYDQKHPILLPSKNHVVSLYLQKEHSRLCHAGAQTVLSNVRLKFWPLDGLREIKRITRKCGSCFRFTVQPAQQLMSDLPKDRVTVSRPFQHVGVDYAGPFMTKISRLRKSSYLKSYAAIFICMVTKAVHIEVVSDLSTEAFIATLRRFIARRGNPSKIFSDNGTNFIGARNRLKELKDLFKKPEFVREIIDFGSSLEIEWRFIPPRSANFGGLWERSVRNAKQHLVRIAGNAHLTFEGLTTVFAQIEAVMNSRPISALSSDTADLSYLTPGHFLIGTALTTFPERNLSNLPENRLSLWQRCTRMQQHFWKRWSVEYLHQLQNRPKWLKQTANLQIGDLVLLKEDDTPPLTWPRARIVEVMPGKDGRIRVARIKTQSGEYIRSISKLCPLPIIA